MKWEQTLEVPFDSVSNGKLLEDFERVGLAEPGLWKPGCMVIVVSF